MLRGDGLSGSKSVVYWLCEAAPWIQSQRRRPSSFLLKAAPWRIKPKKFILLGVELLALCHPIERAHERLPPAKQLTSVFFHVPTWMGIKQFTGAALVVFPNVIRPNRSNSESLTCHLAGVVTLMKQYPGYNSHFLHNEGLWEKNSEPVCVTWCCNFTVWPVHDFRSFIVRSLGL